MTGARRCSTVDREGGATGDSADAPYRDSAYKMVEYDGRPVRKLSSVNVTAPGPAQVFRPWGR